MTGKAPTASSSASILNSKNGKKIIKGEERKGETSIKQKGKLGNPE